MTRRQAPKTAPIEAPLSVGHVARRCGVSVYTIHFYESQGLIKSWRSAGNQRRYSRDVLRRVAVIKVAQRVGIPLSAIRSAFKALPQERTPTAEDWTAMSTHWREDLNARIRRLTQLRDKLGSCIGCGCLSLESCPLYNPGDRLSHKGPGPQLLDPGAD